MHSLVMFSHRFHMRPDITQVFDALLSLLPIESETYRKRRNVAEVGSFLVMPWIFFAHSFTIALCFLFLPHTAAHPYSSAESHVFVV